MSKAARRAAKKQRRADARGTRAMVAASHDASLVSVRCEGCGLMQQNGLATVCVVCGHAYATYA